MMHVRHTLAAGCVLLVAGLSQLGGLAYAQTTKDLSLADLIEQTEPSVVRLDVTLADGRSIGSGFVVHSKGWVVTNHHVVEGAQVAVASFNDDTEAQVVGFLAQDKLRDLVVLKIETERKLKALPLANKTPRKGEATVAIGAPSGLSFTATEGIISAIREGDELAEFGLKAEGSWLQTSTPISPGSSGGPLLNRQGQVVGVNSNTLARAQNINFAISAADIETLVKAAALADLQDLSKIESSAPARPTVASRPSSRRPDTPLPGSPLPESPLANSPLPGSPLPSNPFPADSPSGSSSGSSTNGEKSYRIAVGSPRPRLGETFRDRVTRELPKERDFHHRYKITTAKDDFDGMEFLYSQWLPLKHNRNDISSFGLQVTVATERGVAFPVVIWQVAANVRLHNGLTPFLKRYQFQLLIGKQAVEFPNPVAKGDGSAQVHVQRLTSLIPLDDFLQMLEADQIRARTGVTEYLVGGDEMECLRELVSRLPTGVSLLTSSTPLPNMEGVPQGKGAADAMGLGKVEIQIVLEREAGAESSDSPSATPSADSPTDSGPPSEVDLELAEKKAAAKLRLAKVLMQRSKDSAKKYLEDVLKEYPETKAAQEATKLLKSF